MQSAKDYLQAEKNRLTSEAEGIVQKAESENRSLASEEKDQVKALLDRADEKQKRIDEINENEEIRRAVESIRGPLNAGSEKATPEAKTLGEAFIRSDGYKGLLANGVKSGKWTTGAVEFKAPSGDTLTEASATGDVPAPDYLSGIVPVSLRRLTVTALFAQGSTDSSAVNYIAERDGSAGSVNEAAAVSEAGEKPESRVRVDEVSEPVRKIATVLAVSDEMLEDVPQLRSFIDNRLTTYIALEEENQLLNGNGTPPNIAGILDRQILTESQDNLGGGPLDAVHKAITQIRVANEEPSGIVVHPTDWEIFRLAKDMNEQYYGGGPFTGAYGNTGGLAANTLWGLPVVVTSAITQGTLVVGAFATAAQVFRRSGVSVEATNSHSDYFAYNVTALRAETRLALAVYKPAGFFAVTGVHAESSA